MKHIKTITFLVILAMAILMSGYATYQVLVHSTGTWWLWAVLAAVAIDAAAIWLGTHSADLAKIGDNITQVRIATWFLILASVGVNFYHGYTSGGLVGGLVATIYPILAATLYHFYIEHQIRESLRSRDRILPEKPIYAMSLDRKRKKDIKRDWANLTGDIAEDRMAKLRDKLGTRDNTPIKATATLGTPEDKGTLPFNVVPMTLPAMTFNEGTTIGFAVPQAEAAPITVRDKGTSSGDKQGQPEGHVPDWVPAPGTAMGTTEFAKLCVANGVDNLGTAFELAGTFSGDIKKASLKKSLQRIKETA